MKAARLAAGLAVAVLLGACATTPPPVPDQYTLVTAAPAVADRVASPVARGVVRVAPVHAPAWLQGRGICYRLALAYHDAAQLARYSGSVWAAPVPAMLDQAVQDALAASRRWRAVIGSGDDVPAAFTVRVRLLELCQAFTGPRASVVVLAARVTVTGGADGRVLAQRAFRYRQSAPTPDAAGGVHAARAVVRTFAAALARWVAGLSPSGVTHGAAPGRGGMPSS